MNVVTNLNDYRNKKNTTTVQVDKNETPDQKTLRETRQRTDSSLERITILIEELKNKTVRFHGKD